MNIVESNSVYRIYGDNLKTYLKLPVGTYTVCFDKMSGFSLKSTKDIVVEEKIYGTHISKVDKVMNSFNIVDRNLGVILSGDKGIGKSICAKLIMQKAIAENKAVITVNEYNPGIADFLASIEQDVVIIFDEFEKTFDRDDQQEMLTLFDGLHLGKKLFVVTCNEYRKLNDFLINRPGRFHYHFRFNYPTSEEVREYLQDKVKEEYWNQIENVVAFSNRVNMNYDCLRAISFELNLGNSFKNAIGDLNIINNEDTVFKYSVSLVFDNGKRYDIKNYTFDFFTEDSDTLYFDTPECEDAISVHFNTEDAEFNNNTGRYEIDSKYLKIMNIRNKYAGIKDKAKLIFTKKSQEDIHFSDLI